MSGPLTYTRCPVPKLLSMKEKKLVREARKKRGLAYDGIERSYSLIAGGVIQSKRVMSGGEARRLNIALVEAFQASMVDSKGTIPLARWCVDRSE